MNSRFTRYVLILFALSAAYFLTGAIGVNLATVGEFVAPVWPPAGIALAFIMLYGYRYWPGIAIGSLLMVLFVTHTPPLITVMSIVGQVLEAVVGVYMIRRFIGEQRLDMTRLRDVVGLIVLGGAVSPAISSTIGIVSHVIAGILAPSDIMVTWTTWWLGDAIGILVFAPLFIVWNKRRIFSLRLNEVFLGALTALLLIVLTAMIFSGFPRPLSHEDPLKFLLFPPLLWIAMRFGQFGIVNSIFVISVTSILSIAARSTTLDSQNFGMSLLILQIYLGVISASFMILSAIVAERQRAEQEQRRLIARSVRLDKRRAYFKRLNEAKDEFISLASHQLRTPSTSAKLNLGILQANPESLTAAQLHHIDAAYDANERLLRIIDDLLTAAEVGAGELALQKRDVDMERLLNAVIKDLDSVTKGRKQTVQFVRIPNDYSWNVDEKKFSIAMENLIENASKYSHVGKTIWVEISKSEKNLSIKVKDEGVGIPKKEMYKLFNKFARIQNEFTVKRGGNGLGLYLVKQIIELHGGQITVSSIPGSGTTFTINMNR